MLAPPVARKRAKVRYVLRDGFRLPVSGEVAGKAVEALKRGNGGSVTPAAVVDASRPDEAPLHPCFEWHDPRAAELYREDQARHILRSYCVVTEADGAEVTRIANVAVVNADGDRVYISSSVAMTNEDTRAQVIDEVERMLRGVAARYRDIPELRGLFLAAVERLDLA